MSKQIEAIKRWVEVFDGNWHDEPVDSEWADRAHQALAEMRQAIAEAEQPAQQEPVAWRDHVEQRLLIWRQSFVNKSGDRLALDDFMDTQSLDDLIDFVCDEYAFPQSQMQRKPLSPQSPCEMTPAERKMFRLGWLECEAAHGIKGDA